MQALFLMVLPEPDEREELSKEGNAVVRDVCVAGVAPKRKV
jgi:hypothetical protein